MAATGERKSEPPVPKGDQRAQLFQWCEDQQARIVWGEYLSGRKFCRVRVGRQLEREGPDFVAACLDAKAAHERSLRSRPLLSTEDEPPVKQA